MSIGSSSEMIITTIVMMMIFRGQSENEIEPSSELYHDAISSGTQITREEYFRD